MTFPTLRSALALSFLALLWSTDAAQSHPRHDTSSVRADVRIDEARGLRVRVYVEIPTAQVEGERRAFSKGSADREDVDMAFRESMWERLGAGLKVSVDGTSLPGRWVPADDPRNGHGTREGYLYVLELEPTDPAGAVAADRLTVRIDLDVLPDATPHLSSAVRAKLPWRVVRHSADAILGEERTARWSLDPRLRDLEIVFSRAPATVESP